MKAVILAGGRGLRLQSVIKDKPKPMACVDGKPFLVYIVLQLVCWNIQDIVFSVGYKKDVIKSFFGSGKRWGVNIAYSEELQPLGTGGAIKKSVELIGDDDFLVMNGDSFFDLNFDRIIHFHREFGAIGTLGLLRIDDAYRYGRVEIDHKRAITGFTEKGFSGEGLINGGVYAFNHEMVDYIPDGKISLEKDVLPLLLGKGLYGMIGKGFFIDIGTPESYFTLSKNPGRLLKAVEG